MPMLSLRPSLQSKFFAGYVAVIFLCLFSPLLLQTVSNPSRIETNSGDIKRGEFKFMKARVPLLLGMKEN